ncbi:MAG: hypothetical protein II450_07335 [Prevotella sp.]|jgi:hypothetical protein|nr:hypothetical protein [Prevotella sp.]
MDFKKILNTITSEKGEEILNELKEKGGSLTDMLQDKLQDTLKGKGGDNAEAGTDNSSNPLSGGLEGLLQGKLKDLAEKAKSEIEAKIKK